MIDWISGLCNICNHMVKYTPSARQNLFSDRRNVCRNLFFEVERTLRDKKSYGFIMKNVEGLVTHDKEKALDKIGRTLSTIIHSYTVL